MPFMTPQMQQVGSPGFMGQAASAYGTAMGGYNAAQGRPSGIGSLLGTVAGSDWGGKAIGQFGSWLTSPWGGTGGPGAPAGTGSSYSPAGTTHGLFSSFSP